MKQFLNGFMHRHLDLEEDAGESFRGLFKHTTGVANRVLGRSSLPPRGPLNVAVVDAVFVGIARRLDQGPIKDAQGLRSAHEALKKELAERELYQGSTTHEDRLTERIRTAIQAYAPVT